MKKILIVLIILLLAFPAYAADSTPSADIKAKLEELKKEIASKAAKLKQEVNRKLKDKAYVGKIKTKSPSSLTLATSSGPKIVSLNQDSESKKKISEGDYVACLGDVDETAVLTAKKVILLPDPKLELKTYLWGQIISLSEKQAILKDKSAKNLAVSLPNSSAVRKMDFVILTGVKNKNDIFQAEFVYVIPQGVIFRPKSASHSASPSGSPRTF